MAAPATKRLGPLFFSELAGFYGIRNPFPLFTFHFPLLPHAVRLSERGREWPRARADEGAMARATRVLLAALVALGGSTQFAVAQNLKLSVQLRNDARVGDDTLNAARAIVSQIFSQTEVELTWLDDDPQITIILRPRASKETARRAQDAMGYTPAGGEERQSKHRSFDAPSSAGWPRTSERRRPRNPGAPLCSRGLRRSGRDWKGFRTAAALRRLMWSRARRDPFPLSAPVSTRAARFLRNIARVARTTAAEVV